MSARRVLTVIALVALTGCDSDAPRPPPESAAEPESGSLRAVVESFDAEFGAHLGRLGLRLTRVALTSAPGREDSYGSGGDHLAIYVEPEGAATPAQYVDRLLPLLQVFVPAAFERLAIRSLDICQEPSPHDSSEGEPVPVTAVLVKREHVSALDLGRGDLAALVASSTAARPTIDIVVNDAVEKTESWMNAAKEAGAANGG